MKTYVFKLTEDQANVILNALALRPYCEVAALIGEIHSQADAQENRIPIAKDEAT